MGQSCNNSCGKNKIYENMLLHINASQDTTITNVLKFTIGRENIKKYEAIDRVAKVIGIVKLVEAYTIHCHFPSMFIIIRM